MNPGRELDALVAEKVMGWTLHNSTDIAAAWKVVEKVKQMNTLLEFACGTNNDHMEDHGGIWWALFENASERLA